MKTGTFDFNDFAAVRVKLAWVAREAGRELLQLALGKEISVQDTRHHRGHEESTVDAYAKGAVEKAFFQAFPDFDGHMFLEGVQYSIEHGPALAAPKRKKGKRLGSRMWIVIVDELEGTTNFKLAAASPFGYRPASGVSLAICTENHLGSVVVSAFYSMGHDKVYSSMKYGDSFMAFEDDLWLNPEIIKQTFGDSNQRVLVNCYSNSEFMMAAELKEELGKVGCRIYEGCRASGVDLCQMILNQNAAMVDVRALWPKLQNGQPTQAMLQVYDCAGMLPVMLGCGFRVADVLGRSWQKYHYDDSIGLVVSRPHVFDSIRVVVERIVERWTKENRIPREILPRHKARI